MIKETGGPAAVRLAHPKKPGWYYCTSTATWVGDGTHTTWPIDRWKAQYGGGVDFIPVTAQRVRDSQNRTWEFFGWLIPLYDDNEK